MHIQDYKKKLKKDLKPRTVTFLINKDKVLLGLKKKGFGEGYFLGIGGKVEQGETIEEGARREIKEEINIVVPELSPAGICNFYFPHIQDESWNQQVRVFTTNTWEGIPQESEEIKPTWFAIQDIPFQRMWDDAHYWLPLVLEGKKIAGEFLFDTNFTVVDYILASMEHVDAYH